MELPDHLKNLYNHWGSHTVDIRKQKIPENEIFKDPHLFEDIRSFVLERINIWKKKVSWETGPYTADLLLAKYRFCNIFREFDRQTIEFHTLLYPLRDNFPLWLMNMFYCRMVARTETIQTLGLLSENPEENKALYEKFIRLPRPRFGTPYVFPVSTIMKSPTPTRELFLTKHLPEVIGTIAREITTWKKKSVSDGVRTVLPLFWFNHSFLWTEVLIDTAYQYPEYIDLFDIFPIGPGSLPTMKRINREIIPEELVRKLACIDLQTSITYQGKPLQLSAENWEGIGCEFRKYTNLQNGWGRKRLF